MSEEQDVFLLAQAALLKTVNNIADDQWDKQAAPYMMTMSAVDSATLRELVNRHAYDDAWVADTLAGKTLEEVGTKYDGDLLGDDPKASYARYSAAAAEVVKNYTGDLDKIVHLSYGDFSAREYIIHINTFRGFRAYTIAVFIGADTTLDPVLVQGLWDEVAPALDQWRAMGVFGPSIDVPEGADQQTKLLGLTGFLQV